VAVSTPAQASEDGQYDAHIIDMPFSSVLDTLRRDLGVQFAGDRFDRRRVSDLRLRGTATEVVRAVMQSAQMDSFLFNGQFYYAPIEDRAVRLFPLGDILTAAKARDALDAAGLIIPGYDVREVANGGALVMSGPVRYLALSEGVLAAVLVEPDNAVEPVRVRRGGILGVGEGASSSVAKTSNQ